MLGFQSKTVVFSVKNLLFKMAKLILFIFLNFFVVSSFELTKDFENFIDSTDSNQIATTLVPLSLPNFSQSPVKVSDVSSSSAGLLNASEPSSPRPVIEEANSIGLNDSISLLIVDLTTSIPAQTTLNFTDFNTSQSATSKSSTENATVPSYSESSTLSTSPPISSANSATGGNPRKNLNCNQTPQAKIKIDCRRYFRCVKSKTRFVLRVNSCKKEEYFDNELSSCRIATKGENNCDSSPTGKTNASSRKASTKRRRKNNYRIKNKRNRSLNGQSGVLRLSFDDFDLDDEGDIDLDRLNYRLGHYRNEHENPHVIVISDHEDEDSEESSYESLDASYARNEDEQDDTGMEEKRVSVDESPCKYREKLDDLKRVGDREIIVKNVTEVHINNTIIHVMDGKSTGVYSSPKDKINAKRKDHDLVQNQERDDDNMTSSEDGDRTRRVPKNVTGVEQSQDHQSDSEQSNKNRKITTNTTIIEEHFGEKSDKGEHEVIKNTTSIDEPQTNSNNKKTSSSEFHNGKRIIKNVTTIITEEESSESKRSDQANMSEKKEIGKNAIDQPSSSSEKTDSGIIVTKNVTTIIEEENTSKLDKKLVDPPINQPNSGKIVRTNVTVEVGSNQKDKNDQSMKTGEDSKSEFHSGKRIIKNVTIITEESSESERNDQTNHQKEIDKKTVNQPNSQTSSGRIVTKNVTTIITTDEDKKAGESFESEATKKESSSDQFHNGKRIIKNVTIITEESSESGRNGQTNHQKEINKKTVDQPNPNDQTSSGGIVKKNVTTIITTDEDKKIGESFGSKVTEKEASSDQFHNGKKILKNITTIITEGENTSKTDGKKIDQSTNQPNVSKIVVTNTTTAEESDKSNSEFHGGKRIIKNVTIITEESSESERNDQTNHQKEINKKTVDQSNLQDQTSSGAIVTKNVTTIITTDENKKAGEGLGSEVVKKESSSDQFHNGKRIIKNVTIITEESSESERNDQTNHQKEIGKKIVDQPNPNDQTNSGRIVRKKSGENIKAEQITSTPQPLNDQFHGGKKIVKNVTIITEETNESNSLKGNESNGDSKKTETIDVSQDKKETASPNDGSKRIIKNVTTIITEEEENAKSKVIVQPSPNQYEKIITKNVTIIDKNFDHQLEPSETPCESRLNHLKPIAKIIETHHVIRTLFGSKTEDFRTKGFVNFVRNFRKNVTKVITPNNFDDATSLIFDRNVSDYLVKEVHDVEERVIFEDQPSVVESTSEKPPVTEKSTTIQLDPFKNEPFLNSTTDLQPTYSTIASSQSPKNDQPSLTTPSPNSISSQQPFDFSKPQGPVYFDETGDCRFEGFHVNTSDATCRHFYLCKVDSETGRYTIEPFICVSGQVFDLEKKVCVYKEMNESCLRRPNESNDSVYSSLASKKEEKKNTKDESLISENGENNTTNSSTRPSTGKPILFTEPSEAKRQSTTQKPVSNLDDQAHSIRLAEGSSAKPIGSSSRRQSPEHYSSNEELFDRVRVRTSNKLNSVVQRKSQFGGYPLNNRFLPFSMYSNPHFNPLYDENSFFYNRHRSYPVFSDPFAYNGIPMNIAR